MINIDLEGFFVLTFSHLLHSPFFSRTAIVAKSTQSTYGIYGRSWEFLKRALFVGHWFSVTQGGDEARALLIR